METTTEGTEEACRRAIRM